MKATLTYIPLDEGGYDPQGKYYGIGDALWRFTSEDGEVDEEFRAKTERAAFKEMKAKYPDLEIELGIGEDDLTAFERGYVAAAQWLTPTEDEDGKEGEEAESISAEALVEIKAECRDFQEANKVDLEEAYTVHGYCEEYAGHDFYLTRNGHGAGFWDRGLGAVGDRLTKASEPYGSTDNYWVDEEGVLRV